MGTRPTYIGRSDYAWQVRTEARECADPPSSYLRRLWFDSLVHSPDALRDVTQDGPVASELDDLLDLFDHVWNRFWQRMDGLADEEWQWTPTADERIGLRWRLGHIRRLLSQDRTADLFGSEPEPTDVAQRKAANATSALADVLSAYTWWRRLLASAEETSMAEQLGEAAGPFGEATRRSFVLHVADELIHHCAEAALLRDLFAEAHPAG